MSVAHVGVTVREAVFEETVSFYLAALAPLGYKEIYRPIPTVVGLGSRYPDFWIAAKETAREKTDFHVAFTAPNRDIVGQFHEAALKAGGIDNGAPGPRPQYAEKYYGAFVFDPVGNNIEAVTYSDE